MQDNFFSKKCCYFQAKKQENEKPISKVLLKRGLFVLSFLEVYLSFLDAIYEKTGFPDAQYFTKKSLNYIRFCDIMNSSLRGKVDRMQFLI